MPLPADTLSAEAKRILALLNNARELSIEHQQRPLAKDVLRACKIAVGKTLLDVDETPLDELIIAISDKMRAPLEELFRAAEHAVMAADLSFRQKGSKKSKLLSWEDLKS